MNIFRCDPKFQVVWVRSIVGVSVTASTEYNYMAGHARYMALLCMYLYLLVVSRASNILVVRLDKFSMFLRCWCGNPVKVHHQQTLISRPNTTFQNHLFGSNHSKHTASTLRRRRVKRLSVLQCHPEVSMPISSDCVTNCELWNRSEPIKRNHHVVW